MGCLQLVGSLKLWVSFAKEPYQRDDILHKRPIILRSLLIVATPYHIYTYTISHLYSVCTVGYSGDTDGEDVSHQHGAQRGRRHVNRQAFCRSLKRLRTQHTETRCNTLQHAATRCNTLQHAATHRKTMQHTEHNATQCNTPQNTASNFYHTAPHCCRSECMYPIHNRYRLLLHTATHCNTLQHTATHCNTLQHTATHYTTLP